MATWEMHGRVPPFYPQRFRIKDTEILVPRFFELHLKVRQTMKKTIMQIDSLKKSQQEWDSSKKTDIVARVRILCKLHNNPDLECGRTSWTITCQSHSVYEINWCMLHTHSDWFSAMLYFGFKISLHVHVHVHVHVHQTFAIKFKLRKARKL